MSSETEPGSRRILTGPVIVLVAFFFVFLFTSLCVLSVVFLYRQRTTSPVPQQVISDSSVPAESPPEAMPNERYSAHLPVILSPSGGVEEQTTVIAAEQVWIVTKIKPLGYRSGKHRYDLATFRRVGDQVTAKGYCINPGWDVPRIGTQYHLNSDGTFTPLQDPQGDPYQRFMRIP